MVTNPAVHQLNNIEVQGGDSDFALVNIAGSADDVLLEYDDSAGQWSFAGVVSGSDLADGSVTVEELAAALGTDSNNPVSGTTYFENLDSRSVNTEVLGNTQVNITERYLAADGNTDDTANLKSAIESEEGNTLVLEGGTGAIKLDSQLAPTTNGNRTIIDCRGNPTIDVSAVSTQPAITFQNADNVTLLGPVEIRGATGTSGVEGLRVGHGFRFIDLTFQNGGGGLRVTGTDVWGRGVTAVNQDNGGTAACVHITNAEDVTIYDVEGRDSNRGIETEDNDLSGSAVDNVTVEGIKMENISQFVLDVHTHVNGSKVENVTYRDFKLVDCDRHINVNDPGPGVEDITFDDGEVIDCGENNYISGTNVIIKNVAFDYPTTDVTDVLQINGGRVTCKDIRIDDGGNNAVRIIDGIAVKLKNFRIDGSHTRFLKAEANANLRELIIEGTEIIKGPTEALLIDSDATVNTSRFASEIVLTNNAFYNKKVEIRSPNGVARLENTEYGTNAISTEYIENGEASESASAEEPQFGWPVGVTVHFTDSGDGSGTGVYTIDPNGSPVQIS